jgi:hypothetical protein
MDNACANIITANPADVILFVFALIVLVVLVWCVWAFFYSVFLFIFSKWDDSKVKSAWNCIRYMIIWLFITVMLLFMWPSLLRLFRVPNADDYSAKYIFVKVGNIVTCVSTWIVKVLTDYPNNNPFWATSDPLWITQSIWWWSSNWLTVYEL